MLPVLTYTAPEAAADALRWRHSTLRPGAGAGAGARPARAPPSRGAPSAAQECSALLAGRHGGLPHQRRHRRRGRCRYVDATGDDDVRARGRRCELLVETARLWRSLATTTATARFRIDGVTGPDEYSAVADNNVYTNLMARQNLPGRRPGLRATGRTRPRASASTDEEIASWRDAADR